MPQWSWLIVPVTMFVLFLLSQILKRNEEKDRASRRPAPRPEQPEDTRSDMQRFLDEVQRLRDQATRKREAAAPPWSPPPRPVPVVEEVRQPIRVTPRPVPQRRQPVVRPRPAPEVLEVIAVDQESASRAAKPVVTAKAVTTVLAAARRPVAPIAVELLSLLSSPRSLATAVLLKEVLDRPLALRSERR